MCNGLIPEGEKANLLAVGKWIKVNKGFIYDVVSAGIEAENADMLTDGKYYYAVIRRVPMCANANVARAEDTKVVTIKTDKKVYSARWLDNGKNVKDVKKNSFPVEPFSYGYSYGARVAKFKLR